MKTLVSALTLSLGLLATSAQAEFAVNVGAISVMPSDSSSNLGTVEQLAGLANGSTGVGVNNNTQLGLTFDYRIDQNWAVQLIAATPFSHDISGTGAIDGLKVGKTKHLPPTLLAQYYFASKDSNIQPFVGLGVNYTQFFSTKVDDQLVSTLVTLGVPENANVSMSLKSSFGLAAQAGVNIKLADNLGLHLMVSKIDIDTKAQVKVNGTTIQAVDVAIDPLVAMIGLRWTL